MERFVNSISAVVCGRVASNALIRLALLGVCLLSRSVAAQTLHTVDAIEFNAQFTAFGSDSQLLFSVSGAERKVDIARIVRWGSWPGIRDEQAVWLSDGSWLCGSLDLKQGVLSVTNDWLQIPEVSLNAVRGIVLSPPTTTSRWLDIQKQMITVEGESDVLWLAGGRKISGVIRWPTSRSGKFSDSIDVETAGKVISLPLDTISAIVLSPTLMGPLPAHDSTIRVGLSDGSLLFCRNISVSKTHVTATLENSLALSSFDDAAVFSESVVTLEGTPSETVFLSQLAPTSYRHISDSTLTWELGSDKDLFGNLLHTRDGIFSRGLACHSSSQVAYRWDGSPAQFLCEASLAAAAPQAARSLGSVSCQVLVARNGTLEKVHEFSLKRSSSTANEQPQSEAMAVDITDAKLVVLVTDKSDFGQYGDQVLWLDARISQSGRVR